MKNNWSDRKNILCIRLDNMGDLMMSSPAIQALKNSFTCKITVLTSTAAAPIARNIRGIDEIMVADVPWVKSDLSSGAGDFLQLVTDIRKMHFDAAVIFSVYSQNPLPSVMLAYFAGIPQRLAYCRENPYHLLTAWIPEQEPYSFIRHQVKRDLDLVAAVGAKVQNDSMSLDVPESAYAGMRSRIEKLGIDLSVPWIMVHPGASEIKRQYPPEQFNNLLRKITEELDLRVILTGTISERLLTEHLRSGLGDKAISIAGVLSLEEFLAFADTAPLILTVNTATVHIGAALQTPLIVLYAVTNPQHTPWKVESRVFPFAVDEELKSKNEVIRYVTDNIMDKCDGFPNHDEVISEIRKLLKTASRQPASPR